MLEILKADLMQMGLSDKEAGVYLALLQLRSANPQEIARSARVNRSTTYLALQGLQKRGLASMVEKLGKTHFIAEHPERLARLVEAATREIEKRRERITTSLPHLLALFQASSDVPRVRFFEGEDALHHAREEMVATREPLWEVYAVDESMVEVAKIRETERIKLTRRVRGGRLLIAVKPGYSIPQFDPEGFEARIIDYTRCPFSGSVTLAGHKLCVITRAANGMGILIDSQEMTRVFHALFESVWPVAQPIKNNSLS